MYKEFYGFTIYPFSITPDPQFSTLAKAMELVCTICYIALNEAMGSSFSPERRELAKHYY